VAVSNGPFIVAKCTGCDFMRAERYRVQGDSGTEVSCAHPAIGSRAVGDTRWETPAWCPLLVDAAEQYLVTIRTIRAGKEPT
jgi:hypothetical protein